MLYIISTTIDCVHQLCFLYMLHYPAVYSSEREREAVDMQGTVFALARLEIVPSIELVSYPMPEHDELKSLVRIKLQQLFPGSY